MFARTKRLILRPGWSEDAPALAAAIGHEDVIRNLIDVPRPYDIDDAIQYLHRDRDPRLPDFLAFARTGGPPRLIGGCSVVSRDNRLELGYWVARPFWGLGFATEAAEAVMRVARATHMGRITSLHIRDNKASGNVLRKLGFRPTGRTEEHVSPKCNIRFSCMEFEDAGDVPMSSDMANELYLDRAPMAA